MPASIATEHLHAQLVTAFRAAREAANDAGLNDEDGGTCNLDSPAFRLKGVTKRVIERAARQAGCGVSDFTWFGGHRWFWLQCGLLGQGNRRSRMSRAATDALKEANVSGMEVCEYCQMD
jgi:hypothetical protein